MGEKRHRQQQRRQRRRAHGGAGSTTARRRQAAVGREADLALAELMSGLAEIAAADAAAPIDALDAERWASSLLSTLHVPRLPGEDVEQLFLPAFVDALERLGTAPALATLRAVGAVAAPRHGARARSAADRLATAGLPEPAWSADVGRTRPTAAALMSEEHFDDGVSILIEFAAAGGEPHTLGVYIDNNLGGLVKDVFVAGPLTDVRAVLVTHPPGAGAAPTISELDLAEARARVESALDALDHTLEAPVDDDVGSLRALIDARMRLLPGGFALPDEYREITVAERDELLEDFLASPEGRRWRGDGDAEDIAELAIDFGADYNHGGPLRWSPVVVEVFMTGWLARKVAREPAFFERVPEVLSTWVAYAGRRRGVPSKARREAVGAVKGYRAEMLDAANDPDLWGPAKTIALAAQQEGVDLSDPAELERFVERYNDGLAA